MLNIALGRSRILILLLGAMHFFGIALPVLLPLPLWLKLVLAGLGTASLTYHVRRDCLRNLPRSLVGLQLGPDCTCLIGNRRGEWREADVLASSFVAPYLTLLNLRPRGSRFPQHVVVLPDAVAAEDFRQLRVLLRWKCARRR